LFRPPLPPAVQSTLAEVRSWAAALAGGVEGVTAAERAAWLVGLRQLADATEAAFTQTLASFDAHGDGEALHGARSTSSWLQGALHLAPADASERVRIARGAGEHLSAPMSAMTNGTVSYDQLRTVARSVRSLPAPERDRAVDLLTELAEQVDAGRLRVAARTLRHVVDPDGAAAAAEEQFERRELYLSPLLDGMTAIDGLLDAEGAALLNNALAPFLVPAGRHDERRTAQRRADGLVELARVAVAAGTLPQLSGTITHLDVSVPFERLRPAAVGEPARLVPVLGDAVAIPDSTLRRLGCDATVARIVLGPQSVAIDVGRAARLFSPAQRRALAHRDGGCRFPGCDRPPVYTDAHHLVSWLDGGPSDLSNAVLLCRHHHRQVHEGGWQLCPTEPGRGANGPLRVMGRHGEVLAAPRAP
jgi:hypothetical protein